MAKKKTEHIPENELTPETERAPENELTPETERAQENERDTVPPACGGEPEILEPHDVPAGEESAEEDTLEAEREKYLRLAAEYDNFRKRSAREREAIFSDVRAETITKLLPVFDNLERALKQPTSDEAYKKGVEMTMAQLMEIFQSLGVTEIPALGEAFDPNLHNAVMHIDDESEGESVIVEEFQRGFRLGDRVIRFSLVKVAN